MNIYFISGLGADRRAFQKIRLSKLYQIHHIDWIDPLPGESLKQYVSRLATQVDQTAPFSIVGLSFGGVIAIEMSKMLRPKKLIIISSISRRSELPKMFQLISAMNIHKMIPASIYKKPTRIVAKFFGAKRDSDRKLLYQIFETSNGTFLKWAVDQLLKWKNIDRPDNLYHIHGAKDKLLPVGITQADIIIPGAGHLLIITHASKVSQVLEERLSLP